MHCSNWLASRSSADYHLMLRYKGLTLWSRKACRGTQFSYVKGTVCYCLVLPWPFLSVRIFTSFCGLGTRLVNVMCMQVSAPLSHFCGSTEIEYSDFKIGYHRKNHRRGYSALIDRCICAWAVPGIREGARGGRSFVAMETKLC